MNQAKKRLTIIKLAISMTDTETIQLQVLKLGLLKTDNKMREILTLLNKHNYVQAQKLIAEYIDSPEETSVIQRTSQEEIQQAKEKALVDQFELFSVTSNEEDITKISNEVHDEDFDTTSNLTTETISYDTLLNVDAEDVLPDNITLDISDNSNINSTDEEFFNETIEILPHEQKDDLFSTEEVQIETEEPQDIQSYTQTEDEQELTTEETIQYKAISYIEQKFKHMANQYHPIHSSETEYTSVNKWLLKISNEGYLESDIEEIIKNIDQLITIDKAEAAQLLLIAAATESKYAQFRLARALYKGELLEKNISEAFILINRLAMNDNYPEAICDLGQFYESGTGTTKDEQKAKELYKEAMQLGISRAENHYKRLDTTDNSLLSFFKK